MTTLEPGRYTIQAKDGSLYLIIGPVPPIFPPVDVPVSLDTQNWMNKGWLVQETGNNLFSVYEGTSTYDYRWDVISSALFVSATKPAAQFKFNSAGDDTWTIEAKDGLLLTKAKPGDVPQLIFSPPDEGQPDTQRFILERYE